jgi:hypothetical protein
VSAFPPTLPELDDALLAGPVRRATRSDDAEVIDWRCEPIGWTAIAATTAGIYRVSGTARDPRGDTAWTLVIKILRRPADAVEVPEARGYWRREADAYESDLLSHLEGVSAPLCYGTTTRDDEATVWLWLEHVVGSETVWPLSQYAQAARALGIFNGSYAARRPLPDQKWLSRRWLRSWVEWVAPPATKAVTDEATWRIPVVQRGFRAPVTDRVLLLCERVPRLLELFEALPSTLSHHDCWRTNFILPTSDRTVLIDWSAVGLSPVGLDLGILTSASHFFLHRDPDDLEAFDRVVFAAYLDGLRATGSGVDERVVRFAYATTAALWGGITAPAWLPLWGDPAYRTLLEGKFGRRLEALGAPYARALGFMLDLGDEAWALLSSVA